MQARMAFRDKGVTAALALQAPDMVKDTQPFSIKGLEAGRGGGDTAEMLFRKDGCLLSKERRERDGIMFAICSTSWPTLLTASLWPLCSLHLIFKKHSLVPK